MKVSRAELAKKLQVTRQRIHAMEKAGLITTDEDGKIDFNEALKAIADNYDPARGGRHATPREGSFYEERTRKERALANLREIEFAEKRSELVNAADMKRELARLFVNLKTRLRAIPTKSAQSLAHLKMENKSPRELMATIQTLLLRDIDEALEEISHWDLSETKGVKDK